MAHKILGIDLGTYSVKVAELEAGFRQAKLIGLYERPLAEPVEGESELERKTRTLKELIVEERLEPEMCATTLGGEAVIRLLTIQMENADRKKIEQVLRFELESQILGEIDELVTDFVVSSQGTASANVIVVAAPKGDVQARIAALAQVGAEPRVVGAAALSYAALRGHAFTSDANDPPQVIVDIGHTHTHVCVVHGEHVLFARSIPRGGADVDASLAEAFRMTPADALQAKHAQSFILAAGATPESPSHRKVDTTVREAVRPLVRELRQTLASYRAGGGPGPAGLLLTGGGALLRGFAEHLQVELGMPVGRLSMTQPSEFIDEALRTTGIGEEPLAGGLPAQALGLALAAAISVPQANLRKGDLAYRSDYSYLRGKAGYLAVAVLAVLMFAAINAVAALRGLRTEAEALELQLKKATTELFGEARLDAKAVSEELHAPGSKGGAPPIPTMTAYDLLDEISRNVPPADKGKLDILELDIKPKKTFIKATAESVQHVDDLVAALEKIECFERVEKSKISSVTQQPSGDNAKGEKASEMKQFNLTITTTCP